MPTYNNNENRSSLAPHVDSIIDSFVPSHIQANFPDLIAFLRAYLAYLEESNLSGYYQNTLQNQRDIRLQDQEFLRRIEREIGLFVPRDYEADPQLFYDRISDLWRAKGTEEGLKLFFRLFLDDPVQIRLPFEQVLIPSDGRFVTEDKIRISVISGNGEDFGGKRIIQVDRFAEAVVSKVERRVYSDGIIFELILARGTIAGEFNDGSVITVADDLNTRAEVYRSVTNLKINNPGSGHRPGDFITLDGKEGVTFTAYVDTVDQSGGITSVRIANHGSGNTPNHIKESNQTEEYFLEDFLLFEYDTNNQVGPNSLTFNVDTIAGTNAAFEIEFGALIRTAGRYVGVKGQLSESIVLQDSFFFQKYSYEVLTNFPISRWQGPIKKTVSPAGTIPFANIRVSDQLELGIDTSIFSTLTVPGIYNVQVTDLLREDIIAIKQDYAGFYFAEDYAGEIVINEESLIEIDQDYNVSGGFYFEDDYAGPLVFDQRLVVGDKTSSNTFTTESIN